ncbi:MAG: carboxypeptidase-like regulatory domain-containing protein, partial [Candidatus Thorarchaeota archaeon]
MIYINKKYKKQIRCSLSLIFLVIAIFPFNSIINYFLPDSTQSDEEIFIGRLLNSGGAGSSIGIEVTIDTAVYDATDEYNPGPNVVFINDSHGYVFFQKTNGDRGEIVYYKTTDNGSSWSGPTNIDCGPPQYTFRSFSCWYDQWTPNNIGTKIHIIANGFDNDEMVYNFLNTSDDSTNGIWTSVMPSSGAHNAPDGGGVVTVSTEGYIFGASWMTGGPQFGKYITSWSDITPTYPFLDDDDDHGQLLPLSGGDILCLYEDSTANTLYSFVYNETTDSWDSFASIVTNITSEGTIGIEDANWGAVLDPSTHNVYLMLNNDILDAGGDLETWIFFDTNRSWSQKANIVTNIGIEGDEVKPAYDYARNTLFAIYIKGNDIFVKNSTDGGGTWGSAQKVTSASREWNVIRTNFISIDRIYAIYFDEVNNEVFGNTVADLKPGPMNATIQIYVKDLDNRIVPNAQVNLTDSGNPELTWIQNTTSGGYTIFTNLAFGFYNITVEYEDSINDTLTFLEIVGEDPYDTDPYFEFTVIVSEYVDNSPPTVSNILFNNDTKTFFADVFDESTISSVFLNLTAINLTDASVCIDPTEFLMVEQTENRYYNATALNTLTNNDVEIFYNIIASDIANNTRVTMIKSLNLQDIVPPTIHEYNVTDYGNGTLQFYANITDSSFVQDPVDLKINDNLVQMHLNSSGYWIYRTQAFYGKSLNYTIYSVNDSVGNENGSKVHSLMPPYKIVTPSDNVPPVIWGTTDTFLNHQRGYVNFSTYIDDWNDYQSGVNASKVKIILSINNQNFTYPMESIEEERYYFEFTFEFNDNITYWITATDLANNSHPGFPHNYTLIGDNAIPDVTFEAREFGNSTVEFAATVTDWPNNQTTATLYFTQDYFGTWMNTSMINLSKNIFTKRLHGFDYNRYDVWYYVIANDTSDNSFEPSPDQFLKVELTDKVSPVVAFSITNSSENDGEITVTTWAIDSYGRTPYINNTFYINITTLEGTLTSEMEY